jgi:hypothetical protein
MPAKGLSVSPKSAISALIADAFRSAGISPPTPQVCF